MEKATRYLELIHSRPNPGSDQLRMKAERAQIYLNRAKAGRRAAENVVVVQFGVPAEAVKFSPE